MLVNAQSPLSTVAVILLRVAACLAALSVIVMWFVTARKEHSNAGESRPDMFGRGYLVIVAAEVILLFGGLRVLAALGTPEHANVAWVAFVSGVLSGVVLLAGSVTFGWRGLARAA